MPRSVTGPATRRPNTASSPFDGKNQSGDQRASAIDLPQPDGPTIATNSPRATSSGNASSSASVSSGPRRKSFETPRTAMPVRPTKRRSCPRLSPGAGAEPAPPRRSAPAARSVGRCGLHQLAAVAQRGARVPAGRARAGAGEKHTPAERGGDAPSGGYGCSRHFAKLSRARPAVPGGGGPRSGVRQTLRDRRRPPAGRQLDPRGSCGRSWSGSSTLTEYVPPTTISSTGKGTCSGDQGEHARRTLAAGGADRGGARAGSCCSGNSSSVGSRSSPTSCPRPRRSRPRWPSAGPPWSAARCTPARRCWSASRSRW
mgnify:CR=1 FL=1